MAETRAAANGKGKQSPAEDERTPTKRLILRREVAIVLPEGIDVEHADSLLKLVKETVGKSSKARVEREAWLVVDEREGSTMRAAIEAHAGKPGTPDARPGVYKAPTVGAFSGGRQYLRPPQPKIEGMDLDD